jgi:hypothetical protein
MALHIRLVASRVKIVNTRISHYALSRVWMLISQTSMNMLPSIIIRSYNERAVRSERAEQAEEFEVLRTLNPV